MLASLQPTIISMWNQFSEYEAPAMATLPGTFPIVIGLRLKTLTYYGNHSFPHMICQPYK